ncbi:4'-phosphopantetheinyl transferase family protein [Novosphingobium beihaiensis]|uniref:4'-phosphopantetheinyl transferase superfamily protein n=1 Tax=Novosphingobium beihaiensis TaxID=2930389 RepID=A0ABT0BTB8_9SPHN|nr:4'-phosphopantetheinyl transferase superfamily protein [Novosphingobium beihaiensis]MCJ2188291.1 4'-phosphopantetheinyl transferase superfamily protein [Novosphingobium beihaiensis]
MSLSVLGVSGPNLPSVDIPAVGGVVFLFPFAEWEPAHDELTAALSAEETARADAKRFAEDRMRRRLSSGLTRMVLARVLGCGPGNVDIVRTDKGKPFVPGATFHFSVSHSRALHAVGLARCPVGIDAEPLHSLADSLADSLALAELFLREDELEEVRRLPEEDRDQLVLRLWTEREAYLKMTGRGIDDDLQNVMRTEEVTGTCTMMRGRNDLGSGGECGVHYLGVHMNHHLSFASPFPVASAQACMEITRGPELGLL